MGSRLNKNSVDSIVFDSTLRLIIIIGRCQKKILEGVPMSFKKKLQSSERFIEKEKSFNHFEPANTFYK